MNRLTMGTITGAVGMLALLGVAWFAGWIHVGSMGEMQHTPEPAAEAVDEHAGHEMPEMPAMPEMQPTAAAPDPGAATAVDEAAMPAGAVMITPERQQLIGVRTAAVVEREIVRTIRTVGTVAYDERQVAHIHTRVSGWIQKLYVDFTGMEVGAQEPLLEIYSPELVATQEEYLLALRSLARLGDSPFPDVARTSKSLLEATRRRLLLWDITPEQIAALEERQKPEDTLTLYSPQAGYVINKSAYEGQYVGPVDPLFSIADLTTVWVLADIYESELPYVRTGQAARINLSYLPGRTFGALVDYVYPYMEGETRTAKLRLVLDNPRQTLKPDMFADVEITANLGRSLVVPEDAVIDTGARQVVFLALEGGHFLPREVQVGARFDAQLQITSGLQAGDIVVSGAAFLIDSESKLRSALSGMGGHQH